jgi:hypothetical protein
VLRTLRPMARRSNKAEERVRAGVLLGTFGGTLRSELDEPSVLEPALQAIADTFKELHQKYDDGEMSEQEFGKALSEMIYVDSDGAQWTMGASTTRWYRRRVGGRWSPTPPDLVARG